MLRRGVISERPRRESTAVQVLTSRGGTNASYSSTVAGEYLGVTAKVLWQDSTGRGSRSQMVEKVAWFGVAEHLRSRMLLRGARKLGVETETGAIEHRHKDAGAPGQGAVALVGGRHGERRREY